MPIAWIRPTLSLLALFAWCLCGVQSVTAQDRVPDLFRAAKSPAKPAARAETLLEVSLKKDETSSAPDGGDVYVLSVGMTLPPGSYTYPISRGGFGATRIQFTQTVGLEPTGEDFVADREPHAVFEDAIGQTIEKFDDGGVTWSRRFRLLKGTSPNDVKLAGRVKFQVCNLNCTPHDESFEASLTAPVQVFLTDSRSKSANTANSPAITPSPIDAIPAPTALVEAPPTPLKVQPFEIRVNPKRRQNPDPVQALFRLSPEDAKPGEAVILSITMRLEPGWHTFALDQNPKHTGLPTLIELLAVNGLQPTEDDFSPSLKPELEVTDEGLEQRVHHKEITWTRQFTVEKPDYGVAGKLHYQICRTGQCRPLLPVAFALGHIALPEKNAVTITTVEPNPPSGPEPSLEPESATNLLDSLLPAFKGQAIQPVEDGEEGGLSLYLLYAFLGGMILNVMPCVLPVIAIKVLSFVQQAGESRRRILALNLTYSLGVIVVFLVLASLAVFAQLGWGNLFQKTEFQVAMSCVVFAMSLSLLGVFEIPVPGLIGSAASQQHQEGLPGAFLTGIFATLLATPCSGPFLGVTLGWSVQQPTHITYLVWFVMGLGMASPYAILGLFPGWVRYLPKPGNWMVTFKQVCGFVLLATVLFLMSSLRANWLIPQLILLLAIAISVWMIGNLYNLNSPARRRWSVRLFATLIGVGGGWYAVGMASMKPGVHELPWKPFAGQTVDAELQKGRTVLIDFTAEWCLSCKTNEKLALNTADTLRLVKDHKVVALKADWTHEPEEITRWLKAFDSISVPLTVIFPGNQPTRPIVIRDLYSKSTLLEKLERAIETDKPAERAVSQR